MIIATAGHIDHGKTSLVRAITGVDTDRLPEEKKRGMSIDLGFAYQPIENGKTLGFVDVPGHEKFIRNMLAGVTGIDYAMLIIAADDGPMPQTIEHLAILDLLGVSEGIVALTKIDREETDRLKEVKGEIEDVLAGTCLEGADILPVSAITGDGVQEVREHLEAMSELLGDREIAGNFRLAIDRCFTVPGAGLVVTGGVFSGQVTVGDQLILSPQGTRVRVRGIHAQNKESETGVVGQRCAVNITGGELNKADVHRGGWLLAESVHDPVPRFDARLRVLPSESKPLKHWTPVHVHLGAAEVPGRVAVLEEKSIAPGESGLVQIVLDRRIGALRGDGFIIRDQSAQRTIAGGRILDPFGPARGRAKPERIAFLNAMEGEDAEGALAQLLGQSPAGVDLANFSTAWNLTADDQRALWASVDMNKVGPDGKSVGLSPKHFSAIGSTTIEVMQDWHGKNPDRPGPGVDALRRMLPDRVPLPVFEGVLESLVAENKIMHLGASYCLPGFEPTLDTKDAAMWKRVMPILEDGYTKPPVVHALSEELSLDPRLLEKFLIRSAKLGLVCQVAKNRFLLPEAVLELGDIVEALGAKEREFGVKEFRDRSGIGRNLAIEILEFFDKSGFTWRSGDVRKVLKPVSDVFGQLAE
jgi:selenocysteine-specific elongation factor